MSVWGFMLGAALTASLYRRVRFGRWETGDFADAVAPAVLVASALMRVGCFLRGCCYGEPSGLPWAITYGPLSPAYHNQLRQGLIGNLAPSSLPVHPTQLYDALFLLGLAFLLTRGVVRLPRHFLLLVAAASCALFRFFLEFVRADSGGAHLGPLTFAQATCIGILLASLAFMWRLASVSDQAIARTGGRAE
jgi:phosphatidylglycerol:prolipoprotein diacylglycerol transferase